MLRSAGGGAGPHLVLFLGVVCAAGAAPGDSRMQAEGGETVSSVKHGAMGVERGSFGAT